MLYTYSASGNEPSSEGAGDGLSQAAETKSRRTGELTHTIFNKIGDFLKEGDLLVVNNTKVIPARLYGYRADKESVTKYEALLLRRVNFTDWECIMRPARKATVGARLKFSDELFAEVVGIGESRRARDKTELNKERLHNVLDGGCVLASRRR